MELFKMLIPVALTMFTLNVSAQTEESTNPFASFGIQSVEDLRKFDIVFEVNQVKSNVAHEDNSKVIYGDSTWELDYVMKLEAGRTEMGDNYPYLVGKSAHKRVSVKNENNVVAVNQTRSINLYDLYVKYVRRLGDKSLMNFSRATVEAYIGEADPSVYAPGFIFNPWSLENIGFKSGCELSLLELLEANQIAFNLADWDGSVQPPKFTTDKNGTRFSGYLRIVQKR